MNKFWNFLALLILLCVAGSIIYRLVYMLRTGRDLRADRASATAMLLAAAQPAATVGAGDLAQLEPPMQAIGGAPYQSIIDSLK